MLTPQNLLRRYISILRYNPEINNWKVQLYMTDPDIEELQKERDRRLFEYIALLEKMNDDLVKTLKQCTQLLSQFTEAVPNPEGFRELLNQLEEIIKVGERVVIKETFH